MSDLISAAELRALIETPLSDGQLTAVAGRVIADLEKAFGAAFVNDETAVTVTLRGGSRSLYLPRRILSVETVTEYDSLLSSAQGQLRTEGTHYYVWPDEGRLERMEAGGKWSVRVVVEYVPQDDRAAWKSAVIDLTRLELDRTAMKSESVAGELSYTAPESWEAERVRIMRRLGFAEVY